MYLILFNNLKFAYTYLSYTFLFRICQAKDSTITNPELVPEMKVILEYCLPGGAEKESMAKPGIKPEIWIKIAPCKSHEVCIALPKLMPGFG